MKPVILFLIILFSWQTSESTEKLPEITLDRLLPKTKQVEMGLHKLTSKERDKLRMFLKGIEEGKKQIASAQLPNVIESQIDGNFEGWEGETVVKLMNGQIWQQSEYYYHYHYAEEGKKQIASAQLPNVIESQIDGNFEGWEGETVVKLMNGQIWQQSEYYYHYHYAFMPKVLIYKSSGVYKMKVEGIKKTVRVIQLK